MPELLAESDAPLDLRGEHMTKGSPEGLPLWLRDARGVARGRC